MIRHDAQIAMLEARCAALREGLDCACRALSGVIAHPRVGRGEAKRIRDQSIARMRADDEARDAYRDLLAGELDMGDASFAPFCEADDEVSP